MKTNIGSTDRGIRVLISVVFFTLYFFDIVQGTFGLVLLIAGVVLLLTSLIGFCPLYAPFGFSTRRKKVFEKN